MIRLKRLELLSDYKMLKAGTIFEFGDSNIIAIAGINGSGKTQLLEILSSILIDLRVNHTNNTNNNITLNISYNLEIEKKENISTEKYIINQNNSLFQIFRVVPWNGLYGYFFKENFKVISIEKIDLKFNIITYSSLKRTPLSLFSDFCILNYLNKYRYNILNNINNAYISLDYVHINEKVSKLIALTLFLFHKKELKQILGGIISVKDINKLSLFYNPIFYRKFNYLTHQYDSLSLPLYNGLDFNKNLMNITNFGSYDFDCTWINNIRNVFSNSSIFYLTLQAMQNFNILGISDNDRQSLISERENLSEKLENKYINNNFYIENITFENNISYNSLADGEKQILNTIGMMIIYQKSISNYKDNIFIFDEPVAHLNPIWKINYISYLEKVLNIKNNDDEETGSQVIFTTHTPEVISDLKKEELHLIKNGEFKNITDSTLGDTINSINKELFEKNYTISTRAIKKINEYYDKSNKEFNIENLTRIKTDIINELGDSAERFELLLEIEKKIKRILSKGEI